MLICSKSRVAPVKPQTIPRLELLGAVLLARLLESLNKALYQIVHIDSTSCWTYSVTVLCWIENHKPWKEYLKRRVQEIRQLTQAVNWRHCPGEWNPADLGTRGVTTHQLKDSKIWWKGPDFLELPEEIWPKLGMNVIQEDNMASLEQVKNSAETTHVFMQPLGELITNTTHRLDRILDIDSFSSINRLLRVTSYVLRFVHSLQCCLRKQEPIRRGPLTANELSIAKNEWIQAVQIQTLAKEIKSINSIHLSNYIKQFNLFQDRHGVVRGRLEKSTLPLEAQNPALLPTKHHLTFLVIKEAHYRVMHSVGKMTLTRIRDTYWMPRGREAVKKFIKRCVVCQRHGGKTFLHLAPPNLPRYSVDNAAPWTNTGVDYAGLLCVLNRSNLSEKTTEKVYISFLIHTLSSCPLRKTFWVPDGNRTHNLIADDQKVRGSIPVRHSESFSERTAW